MWGTAQLAPIGRILVLAGWGLWLGVAGPALADAPTTDSDVAVRSLLDEDPKLSELVRRDPALVDALRDDPGLAGRLALKPSLTQRLIIALSHPWVIFGFAAQFMFMMRFVVQWISSERKKRSHVPVVFWYFSLAGGLMLLTYAIQRRDPVFICGQGLGLLIYVRNLILIYRRAWARREVLNDRAARQASAGGNPSGAPIGAASEGDPVA